MEKMFDTLDKKLVTIKKEGNILTFKPGHGRKQLAVANYTKVAGDMVKISDNFGNVMTFEGEEKLVEAVDWNWMEENAVYKNY